MSKRTQIKDAMMVGLYLRQILQNYILLWGIGMNTEIKTSWGNHPKRMLQHHAMNTLLDDYQKSNRINLWEFNESKNKDEIIDQLKGDIIWLYIGLFSVSVFAALGWYL